MTVQEIYDTMRKAGFPKEVATSMTAIALRESGGDPKAFNGNTQTGDRSYGLLQINMLPKAMDALITEKILNGGPEGDLFDPLTNAKAGHLLWGGNNKNLDVAWYINREGYRQKYESHLAAAQNAALNSTFTS